MAASNPDEPSPDHHDRDQRERAGERLVAGEPIRKPLRRAKRGDGVRVLARRPARRGTADGHVEVALDARTSAAAATRTRTPSAPAAPGTVSASSVPDCRADSWVNTAISAAFDRVRGGEDRPRRLAEPPAVARRERAQGIEVGEHQPARPLEPPLPQQAARGRAARGVQHADAGQPKRGRPGEQAPRPQPGRQVERRRRPEQPARRRDVERRAPHRPLGRRDLCLGQRAPGPLGGARDQHRAQQVRRPHQGDDDQRRRQRDDPERLAAGAERRRRQGQGRGHHQQRLDQGQPHLARDEAAREAEPCGRGRPRLCHAAQYRPEGGFTRRAPLGVPRYTCRRMTWETLRNLVRDEWVILSLLLAWSLAGLAVICERMYALWNLIPKSDAFKTPGRRRARAWRSGQGDRALRDVTAPLADVFERGLTVAQKTPEKTTEAVNCSGTRRC